MSIRNICYVSLFSQLLKGTLTWEFQSHRFRTFVIDWVYFFLMVKWTAWAQIFWNWASRVQSLFVYYLYTFSYWVCSGSIHFHTEYTQEVFIFILSIVWKWLMMMKDLSFHTQYEYGVFLHILSIPMKAFCVYWV